MIDREKHLKQYAGDAARGIVGAQRMFQTSEARQVGEAGERTVELSFSSEAPVPMFGVNEVLDHGRRSVDLSRFNDAAPVFVNHDPDQHVAVVEKAWIDGEARKGRALVRFGRSARAQEIHNDVIDGIRRATSVGYFVSDGKPERTADGEDIFRVTAWQPWELTIGGAGADPTVGYGRTIGVDTMSEGKTGETGGGDDKSRTRTVEGGGGTTQPTALQEYEINQRAEAIAARKLTEDRERQTKIRKLASQHGCVELGEAAIVDSTSWHDFQARVLEHISKGGGDDTGGNRSVIRAGATDDVTTMTRGDVESFSLVSLIRSLAYGDAVASFEREVCAAAGDRHQKTNPGYEQRGTIVPDEVLRVPYAAVGVDTGLMSGAMLSRHQRSVMARRFGKRAPLSVGTASAGGDLVSTDLLSGSFIDVLRDMLAVGQLGATTLTGLVGNADIPRKTAGASAAILATEDADAAESAPAFDQVQLRPRTMAAFTEATRLLLLQSSIDVEALIRSDLAIASAELLDAQALYGSGTGGNATGIASQTGVIASPAVGTATPTWAQTVGQETDIAEAKALRGSLAYLFGPDILGHYKTTVRFAGGDYPILDVDRSPQNTLNGYGWAISHTVQAGDSFFGNWSDMLIGLWGGLDLVVDPYTHSLKGRVRIVMHNTFDVAVRHGPSFAHNDP